MLHFFRVFTLCLITLVLIADAAQTVADGIIPAGAAVYGARDDGDIMKVNCLNDGYDNLGCVIGNTTFLLKHIGHGKVAIQVYDSGRLLFTAPDDEINLTEGFVIPPGMTEKAYDFYLSPDRKLLLVVRGIENEVNVAYIYGYETQKTMRLVQPDRMRFDAAAIHAFLDEHRIADPTFGTNARTFYFVKWKSDKLYFHAQVANYWPGSFPEKEDIGYDWMGCFDTATGKFSTVKWSTYSSH